MGIIDRQSSFNNNPNRIEQKPNPVRGGAKTIPAEILEVKKNRAKVRAFTGDIFDNVKLPSASPNKLGQPSGRSGGWRKSQMVLIEFGMDSPNLPYVVTGFAFSANQLNEENLKTFYAAYPQFTGEIDFTDFHDSGYSIRYSDKITYYDITKVPFMEIDMVAKTFKILSVGAQVEFGASAIIPVPNGTLLNTWMSQMYTCVSALQAAINSAVIVPSDGGAALKTAMSTALGSSPPPSVPPALNTTNLKIS
jgi:hypothetical protein